jgi:hypothetical protein
MLRPIRLPVPSLLAALFVNLFLGDDVNAAVPASAAASGTQYNPAQRNVRPPDEGIRPPLPNHRASNAQGGINSSLGGNVNAKVPASAAASGVRFDPAQRNVRPPDEGIRPPLQSQQASNPQGGAVKKPQPASSSRQEPGALNRASGAHGQPPTGN